MKAADKQHLAEIASLLSSCGLPTDDLEDQDLSLFRLWGHADSLEAVGGLERTGRRALLRSIATTEEARGRGLGRKIVEALEAVAQTQGIEALYLLTESAEDYFAALGYCAVERAAVPPDIRETRQFSSLCPDSATVMMKPMGV